MGKEAVTLTLDMDPVSLLEAVSSLVTWLGIRARVQRIAEQDESPGVRAAAEDILEEV